jgi:hypothetical protein
VMCGPENFHPAGSWNGCMTKSLHHGQASYDVIVPFSYLPLFFLKKTLNYLPSCQRTMFVIMDPTGI